MGWIGWREAGGGVGRLGNDRHPEPRHDLSGFSGNSFRLAGASATTAVSVRFRRVHVHRCDSRGHRSDHRYSTAAVIWEKDWARSYEQTECVQVEIEF